MYYSQILDNDKDITYSSWVVQTRVQQIQGGEEPPSLKIAKLPYLSNGLTDRHYIWHDDTYCV